MDRRVLVTSPEPHDLKEVLRRLAGGSYYWAYLGQSMTEFRRAQDSFQNHGTYVDTTGRFHDTAERLRDQYLSHVYKMGRELKSLRWWLSPLVQRNVYSSRILQQICYLSVALDLADTWEESEPLALVVAHGNVRRALAQNSSRAGATWEWIGRPPRPFPWRGLSDTLRMLAHRVFFLFRECYRIFQTRWIIPQPYQPDGPVTVLISWASNVNTTQDGEFQESYFGNLAKELGARGCQVVPMPMIVRDGPYRTILRRLLRLSPSIFVPHRYLRILDLLRATISSCARPPRPSSIPDLAGMDVKILVEEDLRSHWLSNGAADALVMSSVVKRLAPPRFSVTRFIYLFENQPWERALCWEAQQYLPRALTLGYQHAPVPHLALELFLAPGEQNEAPLPDRVVTFGKHTARLLTAGGFGESRVQVGGALQMGSLHSLRSLPSGSLASERDPTVLIATSIGLEEASELVSIAGKLFTEDEGVKVLLKCHPMMPFEMISKFIDTELPAHVQVSEEPINDLILQSSLMVYSASSVGVQALALGLPAIHLRPQFDLDLDPLSTVAHLRLQATGLPELRRKVDWLLEHREEYIAEHQEEWDRLVEEMYGPITEATYSAFLNI